MGKESDSIIIPVVAALFIKGREERRKHTCDGGTPKCGRVNVLGHKRLHRVTHVEFSL